MSSKNVLMGILGGILTVGVAGSIAISAMTFSEIRDLRETAWAMSTEEETSAAEETNTESEDNVVIAEEYTIESTLPISDAYKSGDSSKLTDADRETLDLAESVLKEVIKDGASDYEKEVAVYEWMAKNISTGSGMMTVVPMTSQEHAIPHGVLKSHSAVCVGFATTFRLFMQMLDIDCKVVHNTEKYHSWDLVNLDGDWYHVDVYSDSGNPSFGHFNQNDAMRAQSESWNTEFFPKADSLKYNYSYQNMKKCKSVYKIPKLLRKAMDKKTGCFMIDFGKDVSEEDQNIAYTIVNNIDNTLMSMDSSELGYLGTYGWMEDPTSKDMIMVIYVSYPSDGQSFGELSDEVMEKVQNAVSESFGDIGGGDMYEDVTMY